MVHSGQAQILVRIFLTGVEEHGVGFCVDLTAAGNSPANIEYSFKDHSIHAL